jgi:hypothetical protein
MPSNWFAIPTVLDDLPSVFLYIYVYMTYLYMSPIFLQNYKVHLVYNRLHKRLINQLTVPSINPLTY